MSIYYKAECKQIYPQWFYLNQGDFPFKEGYWSLLLSEALNRIRVKFCDTRASQTLRSTRMMAPLCYLHPLPECVRRCAWWPVCCVPPVLSGIECDLLSSSFCWSALRGGVQPDGSVYRVGGDMACPPQQMWMLSVSQRFSYSLLLKLVP